MSTKKLNTMIKRAMLELLREQETQEQKADQKDQKKSPKGKKPQKKKVLMPDRAPIGGGRTKADVVGGRAKIEPGALLKDLGVGPAAGNTDIEKAASIISQAIQNNEIMAEAYSLPRLLQNQNKKIYFEVPIKAADLKDKRSALKYVHATLFAAMSAGMLNMQNGINFIPAQQSNNPTVIPEDFYKK